MVSQAALNTASPGNGEGSTPSRSAKIGELTRQGAGAAWKADGGRKSLAIVSSTLRQFG